MWALRLDTSLLEHPTHIVSVSPEGLPVLPPSMRHLGGKLGLLIKIRVVALIWPGELVQRCGLTGLGYTWTGAQLGDLSGHYPDMGKGCQEFTIVVRTSSCTQNGMRHIDCHVLHTCLFHLVPTRCSMIHRAPYG